MIRENIPAHPSSIFENDDFFIREMFIPEEGQDFQINEKNYSHSQAVSIIKKIIIYLIMVFDLLRLFLKVKLQGQGYEYDSKINKDTSAQNEKIIIQKLSEHKKYKKTQFILDEQLLNITIEDLINKISIYDFTIYTRLSQINFMDMKTLKSKVKNGCRTKKVYMSKETLGQSSQSTHLNPNPNQMEDPRTGSMPYSSHKVWLSFEVREFEIDEILMAKRKRPDEELKHSFKSIRKGILKDFNQSKNKGKCYDNTYQKKQKKKKFLEEIFRENPEDIAIFQNTNITKEVVSKLKKCKGFTSKMKEFVETRFIIDEIDSNIWNKKEEIMSKELSLKSFMLVLMTKQKKNGWMVQNILNSLEVVENCSDETILKRKTKFNKTKLKVIKTNQIIPE